MMEQPAPEKKIGRFMLVIMWILILIGLTSVFGDWEEKQYNPNQSLSRTGDTIVTLTRNKYHHYVASGLINNYPVVFLLDTGATDVAVPAGVAKKIGLEPGYTRQAITANGVINVRDTNISSLELGAIKINNVRASINPGMIGDEILLGMSALKDLEFTQSGNTLTLKQIH